MIAREKWSCCEVGKGLGLVLCQSHEWNFVNAATAVSPGLQQVSLVLAGHHLWVCPMCQEVTVSQTFSCLL